MGLARSVARSRHFQHEQAQSRTSYPPPKQGAAKKAKVKLAAQGADDEERAMAEAVAEGRQYAHEFLPESWEFQRTETDGFGNKIGEPETGEITLVGAQPYPVATFPDGVQIIVFEITAAQHQEHLQKNAAPPDAEAAEGDADVKVGRDSGEGGADMPKPKVKGKRKTKTKTFPTPAKAKPKPKKQPSPTYTKDCPGGWREVRHPYGPGSSRRGYCWKDWYGPDGQRYCGIGNFELLYISYKNVWLLLPLSLLSHSSSRRGPLISIAPVPALFLLSHFSVRCGPLISIAPAPALFIFTFLFPLRAGPRSA